MAKRNQQKKIASTNSSKPIPIHFTLTRIEVVTNQLNIPSDFVREISRMSYKIGCDYDFKESSSLFMIIVSYKFSFDDKVIFDFKVENEFRVHNFKDALLANKQKTIRFVQHITHISINQSRGIQAPIIKNTELDGLYLPFISDETIEQGITLKESFNK